MPRRVKLIAVAVVIALSLSYAAAAKADEIKVMISGGLTAAFKQLAPKFERRTGNTIVAAYGPSMGTTENAIPVRLARGEAADVLIMVGDALNALVQQGKADASTRVDLVRSRIGLCVKAGTPKPDISTPQALRAALINGKSIAYSDSASGVYVERELFKKLGIEDQMKGKARMIPAEPVAAVVARGEAELGFQQISELLPIAGAEVVGPIPDEVQKVTIFSAAVTSNAKSPEASKALITFLASAESAPTLRKTGLDPIQASGQ